MPLTCPDSTRRAGPHTTDCKSPRRDRCTTPSTTLRICDEYARRRAGGLNDGDACGVGAADFLPSRARRLLGAGVIRSWCQKPPQKRHPDWNPECRLAEVPRGLSPLQRGSMHLRSSAPPRVVAPGQPGRYESAQIAPDRISQESAPRRLPPPPRILRILPP